jgi:hypothetical protein
MATFELTGPDGGTYQVDAPDEHAALTAFSSLHSQPTAPQSSPVADVAKSAGIGLAQGALGVLGMGGDVGSLLGSATDKVGGMVGASPDKVQQFKDYMRTAAQAIPGAGILTRPGSADLQKGVEKVTGDFYKPQTTAGEYARTIGEFAPAAIGGPESIGAKLVSRVAAPALASETAGQMTKGTAAEPYARTIGAIAGGAGASKVAQSMEAANLARTVTPSLDTLKNSTSGAYDTLTSRNVAIPIGQSTLDNLASDIATTLNNRGIRPSNASSIHQAVEELKTPATAGAADVADLVAGRQSIKELLGKHDTNKAGAFVALNKIETAIEQASPGTMARLKEADKNWAAVRASESLDKRMARADLRAAGADSGMNIGNKIRQQVANYLLSNEARFLPAAAKADLEKVVRGTATQNVMRHVANFLGGGGGLGMLAGASAGYEAGGVPGAIAGAAAGRALRIGGNFLTVKQAQRAAQNIRAGSPLGQQMAAGLPPAKPITSAVQNGLLGALLASNPMLMDQLQGLPQPQR